jgi:3-oxoacyl-[acyl-carrier-protein] synthase-3
VAAYDINSACSGFIYGLATANGLIASGVARNVLLIGSEAFTTLVNPADRVTRPIFGDGAGAVVLRTGSEDEPGALGPFDLGSDGGRADLLAIPSGGSRQRSAVGLGHGTIPTEDWYLQMDGRAIFTQAVARMTQSVQVVLRRVGWAYADVDWFVGHQANIRILHTVGDELGLPESKIAVNIEWTGNTLTASVPLLLNDMIDRGDLKPGHRLLLSAFGAGLSWGSTVVTWPDISVDKIE